MAARPTWKGFMKISLVTIPVRVFPATDAAATISFNQLHAECQTRIQQKRWCPHCEREVPISEIAKGYEFEKGHYVVMTEDDMSKVRPESTRVIDLVQFTDAAAIDPIYVEKPYYLAPDGPMAREAFAVMREGMKGKAGIGKLALYGREYLVAVQPRDKGLVMYTMRHAKEVRSMENIDELETVPEKVKPEEIKLAKQVIGNFEGALDLAEYSDKYQEELQRIIDAKVAGQEVVATEEETPPKVVNLMDALRQSLDRVSTGKKKAAKAEIEKPVRVAAKRRAHEPSPAPDRRLLLPLGRAARCRHARHICEQRAGDARSGRPRSGTACRRAQSAHAGRHGAVERARRAADGRGRGACRSERRDGRAGHDRHDRAHPSRRRAGAGNPGRAGTWRDGHAA